MNKTDILLNSINTFYTLPENRANLLDGYSKKLFDPFCRAEKISYKIPETSHEIHTTVAQLNFIRWCIKNKIVDYIRSHHGILFNKQVT